MAASLLTAVGLTDCIAADLDDYVARAIAFASGARPLHGAALARQWEQTLGDAADFTRRFERALEAVVLRPTS